MAEKVLQQVVTLGKLGLSRRAWLEISFLQPRQCLYLLRALSSDALTSPLHLPQGFAASKAFICPTLVTPLKSRCSSAV